MILNSRCIVIQSGICSQLFQGLYALLKVSFPRKYSVTFDSSVSGAVLSNSKCSCEAVGRSRDQLQLFGRKGRQLFIQTLQLLRTAVGSLKYRNHKDKEIIIIIISIIQVVGNSTAVLHDNKDDNDDQAQNVLAMAQLASPWVKVSGHFQVCYGCV